MDLEFKIIQAPTPIFADTAKMQKLLEVEAEAGWRLLEKEDNHRIKLQRNISYRENDANLSIDAYRTSVGVSPMITYGLTALITLSIVSLIVYFAIWSS